MNAAQKIEKAVSRVEEAAARLQHTATSLGTEVTTWGYAQRLRDLFHAARAYATAVNALRRAGKAL